MTSSLVTPMTSTRTDSAEITPDVLAISKQMMVNFALLIKVNSQQTEMFIQRLGEVNTEKANLEKRLDEKDKMISQLVAAVTEYRRDPAMEYCRDPVASRRAGI